jgi:hypothetical protein
LRRSGWTAVEPERADAAGSAAARYAEDVPELLRYYCRSPHDDERFVSLLRVAAQNRLQLPVARQHPRAQNLVQRLPIQGGPEEIRLGKSNALYFSQSPVDEPLVKQDLLALPLREARDISSAPT